MDARIFRNAGGRGTQNQKRAGNRRVSLSYPNEIGYGSGLFEEKDQPKLSRS